MTAPTREIVLTQEIMLTQEAARILRKTRPELAAHIEALDRTLNAVTLTAWRFATWNDHNFLDDDRLRWRREVQDACRRAQPFLSRTV